MASQVTAPDGRIWHVSRRVTPRLGDESVWGRFRSRYGKVVDRTSNIGDANWLDVFGDGFLVGLAIIAAVLLLAFLIIPLLFAIVDLLILLVLAVVGVALRIALRRPWTVEAMSSTGDVLRWRVVGWRASGEKVVAVAAALGDGDWPSADSVSRRTVASPPSGTSVLLTNTEVPEVAPVPRPTVATVPRVATVKMSRATVIAFVIVGIVAAAVAVTLFTVADNEPSYRPPCARAEPPRC